MEKPAHRNGAAIASAEMTGRYRMPPSGACFGGLRQSSALGFSFRIDPPSETSNVISPDHCPPDPEGTAEAYLLGRLSPADVRAFEDYNIACPACAEVLVELEEFIAANAGRGPVPSGILLYGLTGCSFGS
jgi:hypothetical protein